MSWVDSAVTVAAAVASLALGWAIGWRRGLTYAIRYPARMRRYPTIRKQREGSADLYATFIDIYGMEWKVVRSRLADPPAVWLVHMGRGNNPPCFTVENSFVVMDALHEFIMDCGLPKV